MPADLVVAHTGHLDAALLAAARQLLYDVFDDMTDADWDHCLGGMHALAFEDGRLVGHAALVQRRMLHDGRTLRTGYVEGVGVLASARRRGHASSMMAALEAIAARAYDLAALGASDAGVPLYLHREWRQWQGKTWALTPDGVRRTADEDRDVYVWPPDAAIDLTGDLVCDWRSGDLW